MKTIYKYLNLLFLIVASFNIALAQTVTNVRVQQESEQIIITYDLDKTAHVRVYVTTGQSNQYTELQAVTGDVEEKVQPGTNRRIIWTPLKERTEFVAPNARFKVVALPTIHYFSVSPTKKVAFSPSNLQYHPRTKTWRFAPHQWECIGEANENISKRYKGWIDLFGWGTGDNPTKSSEDDKDYPTFVDWGTNKIGSDAPNTWRTLTMDEWQYLCKNTRWTMAKVNGVLGFMLLPDDFSVPAGLSIKVLWNRQMSEYSSLIFNKSDYAQNQYTTNEFALLEAKGCVFLPYAGFRYRSYVGYAGSGGYYWSATPYGSGYARSLDFGSTCAKANGSWTCYFGLSVRLVQDLR